MENKDFWDDFPKDSSELSDTGGKTDADPTLEPGYRTEDKPTTLDSLQKRKLDIDAILADIQKKVAEREQPATGKPTATALSPAKKAAVPSANRTVSPPSEPSAAFLLPNKSAEPPSGDQEVMREMIVTMRELTEEVKQLRAQIEAKPYDISTYPRGRPPGISTDVADIGKSPPRTQTDNTPEEYLSGFVLAKYSGVDPADKPKFRGESDRDEKSPPEKAKKNKALSIISNVLFYAIIVAFVFGAFLIRSNKSGRPMMIGGYSAMTVLTGSMEDVYPKGSLIITKSVDADKLTIGDDITYMVSETASITHRIIGITEDYQSTGQRGFETQGIMNAKPDKEIVAASNVVGRVVFHSKALGDVAAFVSKNWLFLLFLILVIVGLISFLKWNAKRTDNDEEDPPEKSPPPKKVSHEKRRIRKSDKKVE